MLKNNEIKTMFVSKMISKFLTCAEMLIEVLNENHDSLMTLLKIINSYIFLKIFLNLIHIQTNMYYNNSFMN